MSVCTRVVLSVLALILSVGAVTARDLERAPEAAIADGPARLSVTTPLGEGVLQLEAFRGKESISELFSFELDLVAPGGQAIPFEAVLGKEIRVAVTLPGGETRYFHGICSRFGQGDAGDGTRYQAEIVPRLWLLTRKRQTRIFQDLSVPQILARVLGSVPGLNVEMRLQGTFHPRDYCVQYKESDFAFASRLMQEEGVYFFFKHAADGHTLVIANTPESHPDIPEVPFRTLLTTPGRPNSIYAWEKTQEIRSGKVTLWDYNFQTPGQNHEGTATIQESVQAGQVPHTLKIAGNEALELYEYPGGYADHFDGVDPGGGDQTEELNKIAAEARRTAEVRMQEEAAQSLAIRGAGTAPALSAGYKFSLSRHPSASGPYVLTSVSHEARVVTSGGGAAYHNSFEGIPSGLPYRPLRTIPKPIIPGTQTAIVVGPPGQEIFTDKYGRVKVQFNWDRQGQKDEHSSCWIRVVQPAAGSGSVLIPRVGWEVAVSFEDGDPDEPIILGSVFNPGRMPDDPPRVTSEP
jgi:type VI secretion system secreted protein VgrG